MAIEPGTLLKPEDHFDFASLPAPDTSAWTTYRGVAGTLTFKAPPTWEVELRESKDLNGKVHGDLVRIRKPDWRTKQVAHGTTASGWLDIAISTEPYEVPAGSIGGEVIIRVFTLPNASPARRPTSPSEILVLQSRGNTQFPDSRGGIEFRTPGFRAGDLFLNTFASVDFDALAVDVATVRAIIESVEVTP
jgi:hypothetical protein